MAHSLHLFIASAQCEIKRLAVMIYFNNAAGVSVILFLVNQSVRQTHTHTVIQIDIHYPAWLRCLYFPL